ncbi:type I glyceraldehyde-3-phosphate dehydrogenase [Betaproteobacteria bacterium]|nr:type I glyceraldehyde-3-phosphate dehydrogenase [Betaproteobacteria bacterium]
MTVKVAINGFGRIGRAILRANFELEPAQRKIQIVAINDLASPEANAHLTEFDSTHGRFGKAINVFEDAIQIEGEKIQMYSEKNPADLPWESLGVDIVLECTGLFASKEKASKHLQAGARKVLISAPANDADATVVYGVNETELTSGHKVVSNASCTTNCLAPLAKIMHEKFEIKAGLMTTVHSFTNDQVLVDSFHSDLRRARAATLSMIPTKTGAAAAVGLVLPELSGKLDGFALRVPTANVSVVDLSIQVGKQTSVEEVNDVLKKAAEKENKRGVIGANSKQTVSVDFNHDSRSSIFDLTQTRVSENGYLVKVLSWYDNEWGFSNRMMDVADVLGQL